MLAPPPIHASFLVHTVSFPYPGLRPLPWPFVLNASFLSQDESCGGYDAFDLYELVWPAESTDSEYLDCYNDKKEDRIMSDMLVDPDMTQAVCRTHCEGLDSMYYATQVGGVCVGGRGGVVATDLRTWQLVVLHHILLLIIPMHMPKEGIIYKYACTLF